jgi:hypothetical protein
LSKSIALPDLSGALRDSHHDCAARAPGVVHLLRKIIDNFRPGEDFHPWRAARI